MSSEQGPILDVVAVPDFLGPRRHTFEAQSLFFLASWIECSERTPGFPLHLACIGKPPPSVEKLAERAGAQVTVHAPLSTRENRFLNKGRALDVNAAAERFVLVDLDTLLLGDPWALARIAPAAISAAPELFPALPTELWLHLYRGLGVEPPTERIASRIAELDLPLKCERFDGEETLLESMLPLYNGGGVVSPWRLGLIRRWRETYDRIQAIEHPNHPRWKLVCLSDQPALAVTIDLFRREGFGFERLPPGVNALWQDVHAEAVELDQVHLFHATAIFRHMPPGPVTREGLLRELARYRGRLWRRSRRAWTRERRLARAFQNTGRLLRAPAKVRWLDARLHHLYEQHVRPVV